MTTHSSNSSATFTGGLANLIRLGSSFGAFAVALVATSLLHASSYTFTGTTDNWLSTTTNWSPTGIPTADGDSILFDGTGTYRSSVRTSTVLGGTLGLTSVTLASGHTNALTIYGQPGGFRMNVNGSLMIESGAGALTINPGTSFAIAFGGGSGTLTGTATFTNNSTNAATISTGVTLGRGGSGGGSRGINFGGTGDWNVAATIQGTSNGGVNSLTKSGTGTLTFSGTAPYTAGTTLSLATVTVSGGTLNLTSSLPNPNAIVTVGSAGTLKGTGAISGAAVINGTLAGKLNFASTVTLGGGGQLNWQIQDAVTTFDTTTISTGGSLNLSSLSEANKFNINLWSLSAANTNGAALNFDNTQNYTWTLLSTGSVVSSFSANLFQINTGATNGTSGFTNAFSGVFSVGLSEDSTDLVLNYTAVAVPEPDTYALLMGGAVLLVIGGMRHRRRKQ